MTNETLPTPVATARQFQNALLALRNSRLPDLYFDLLRVQLRSPERTTNARLLALAVGNRSCKAVNDLYGTLGHLVADRLKLQPERRDDGTIRWWEILSYEAGGREVRTAHFRLVMRTELVSALEEMRWGSLETFKASAPV